MNYNTLLSGAWKHRRKIMFAGTLAYGAIRRGFDDRETKTTVNNQNQNNEYSKITFEDPKFLQKIMQTGMNLIPLPIVGNLFHDAGYSPQTMQYFIEKIFFSPREIIGSAIVATAPVTFVGLAAGLKALDFGLNMWTDRKNASLRDTFNKNSESTKVKYDKDTDDLEDKNILKYGDTELGKLYEHTNNNDKGKTLTVFYNHGNAENYTDDLDLMARNDPNIKILKNKYQKINFVAVKQGYEQPVIAEKLIKYFKGNDDNPSDFSIIGFSAGCTSSLQQEKIMKDNKITPKNIILNAPVVDGVGAIMPASTRWLMKPLESVLMNSGLGFFARGGAWHWTCGEALSEANKQTDNNLTIMYNQADEYAQFNYLPQAQLIKAHLKDREFNLREYTYGDHNNIKIDDIAEILLKENN